MAVPQRHFYKDHRGTPMFLAYHPPVQPGHAAGLGVLMAPPVFEEKQDAHRAMVNFAHRLAERGIGVLRFDYRGQGESCGELHEFSPEDLVTDIRFAYEELKSLGSFRGIGTIGVRYGANLLATAVPDIEAAFMIAWAPIYDGANYAKTVLWTNLTTQMMIHRKIVEDRKVLLKKLEDGELIDVDGYKLNLDWYRYLCSDDLATAIRKADIPTLLLDITANPDQENERWNSFLASAGEPDNMTVTGQRVQGDTFWRLTPVYAVRPKATFETSEEYIARYAGQ